MRKQSVTVRCDGDGCKEIADVENLNETPSGWYHIGLADDSLKIKNAGWDFHSLKCIGRWAKERSVVLGETKPVTYKKTIVLCPECGDELGAQGYHHHWRSRHLDVSAEAPPPIKD